MGQKYRCMWYKLRGHLGITSDSVTTLFPLLFTPFAPQGGALRQGAGAPPPGSGAAGAAHPG